MWHLNLSIRCFGQPASVISLTISSRGRTPVRSSSPFEKMSHRSWCRVVDLQDLWMSSDGSSSYRQSLQRSSRRAEGLVFKTELVQHADIEIAQRHRTGGEGQVLGVLEAASGEQNGQVFVAVAVAAA